MKKYILLLLAIAFVGCLSANYKVTERPKTNKSGFYTIEFDSCEYVFNSKWYQGYLAHKGNCKYCAERRQKELELWQQKH